MSTENKIIIGGGILTIVIIIGISFLLTNNSSSSTSVPNDQIVVQNGLHWHPKLAVYIKGEKQEFTDSIGLGAVHQKMHTHAEDYKDGVVHMEIEGLVTKEQTRLGNFFRIWGKEFSSTQIFDKTNGPEGTVKMSVNGKVNTDFENYEMKDKDLIEITFE